MTATEKAAQGVGLASGLVGLTKGLGDLFIEDGWAGLIGSSIGGPETGKDFEQARGVAERQAVREAAASGGLDPVKGAYPSMPISTSEGSYEAWKAKRDEGPPTSRGVLGDISERMQEGVARRAFAKHAPQYGAPASDDRFQRIAAEAADAGKQYLPADDQAQAPQASARGGSREVTVEGVQPWDAGSPARLKRMLPGVRPEWIDEQLGGEGVGGFGRIDPGKNTWNLPAEAFYDAATPAAPDAQAPTPEAPIRTTLEKLREAAEAARRNGRGAEFDRWSKMAIVEGALQLEGLTAGQQTYLEGLKAQQQARQLDMEKGREVGELGVRNFNEITAAILAADSPERVRALLDLATRTQGTKAGFRNWMGDVKNPEMARIESAAQHKLAGFGKDAFPGADPTKMASLRYTDTRADWYDKRKSRGTGGGGTPPSKFRWSDLKKQFDRMTLPGSTWTNEKIEKIQGEANKAAAGIPGVKADMTPEDLEAIVRSLPDRKKKALEELREISGNLDKARELENPFKHAGVDFEFLGVTLPPISGETHGDRDDMTIMSEAIAEAMDGVKAVNTASLGKSIQGLAEFVRRAARGRARIQQKAFEDVPSLKEPYQKLRKAFAGLRGRRIKDEDYEKLQDELAAFQRLVATHAPVK